MVKYLSTKPAVNMVLYYGLNKKTYYQQKKSTYIKKVIQKLYISGPPQVSNFKRPSPYYKAATKYRLRMYCVNRHEANSYPSLTLYKKYTNPKGGFQPKC